MPFTDDFFCGRTSLFMLIFNQKKNISFNHYWCMSKTVKQSQKAQKCNHQILILSMPNVRLVDQIQMVHRDKFIILSVSLLQLTYKNPFVDDQSSLLFFVWSDLSILGISLKRTMPPKTRAVPTQWVTLKGFWKYQIEKRRLRNFLKQIIYIKVRVGSNRLSR